MAAFRRRPADPSGLCLSQVHSSFSNNGSPSACHEQLCSCKRNFVFISTSDLLRSVAVSTATSATRSNYSLRRTSSVPWTVWIRGTCLYVLVPLQCVWACGSFTGDLVTHLHHRHLSFDTLELWEPDAAPSGEHWQSHQSSRSVTTFKSSCTSDSHVLAFHHNGHPHDLNHEQCL